MKQLTRIFAAFILFAGFISCNNDDTPTPNPNVAFLATLNGTSEVPGNPSAFTGTANGTFNTTTKILTVTVTHNVAAPTAGHIHGPAAAGVNAGVVFPFTTLTSPINFTSGPLTAAQETDLNANLNYVNLHTAAFPGGEIRGQLIKQ